MFDTIPEWFSKKTMSKKGWAKTKSYTTPKMPWGIDRNKIESMFGNWLTKDIDIIDIGYPVFPRGVAKWLFLVFSSMPGLRDKVPTIVKIRLPNR